MDIILTTLNVRYTHTLIALKYLMANLKELQSKSLIMEFVINNKISLIAEKILEKNPKIVGISVYIWNALDVKKLIDIIKLLNPSIKIVLSDSEVSYEPLKIDYSSADYIVSKEGEEIFYEICRDILNENPPNKRFFVGKILNLKELNSKNYQVQDYQDMMKNIKCSIQKSHHMKFYKTH